MNRHQTDQSYEVWCGHCRVSFPVGHKKCMHCGGRLGPRMESHATIRVQSAGGAAIPEDLGQHTVFDDQIPEEEVPRRGGLRSPMTIIWVVLALATAVYRACTGG